MSKVVATWALVASSIFASISGAQQPTDGQPRFSSFSAAVDLYLDTFAQFHPSIAAGNGLHTHDDLLEDYSLNSISKETHWLHKSRQMFDSIPDADLSSDERVDRRIITVIIDGWLLDLNTVQTWMKNPLIYVASISDGLHDLMTMESAPAEVRMRHIQHKLRSIPRLIAQARHNVTNPPRVFIEQSVTMLQGVSDLLSHDLALAFADVSDKPLKVEMLHDAQIANGHVAKYARELTALIQKSSTKGYAIGTQSLEARYRAEELIDLPARQLLGIGTRELVKTQAQFAAIAHQIDPTKTPSDVWRSIEADHPLKGDLVPAARAVVTDLFEFIASHDLLRLPAREPVEVAPAPAYDIGMASMHSSPPLETHPVKSFYYITDAQEHWSTEQSNAWLERFNYPTLADVTAHEVAPGHYVHSLYMRQTRGKIRKIWIGLNPFPQPSSGQDGWAHYAEQMISDEGFHSDDPRYRLAQTAEALTRICRLIAGIQLHSEEWSVDDATKLFMEQAHLGQGAARHEAVRGTYDPTYGGYFLGKLAAFKLRQDYQNELGGEFRLATFHERVMTNGIAPWWAHRQLLMPGNVGTVLE